MNTLKIMKVKVEDLRIGDLVLNAAHDDSFYIYQNYETRLHSHKGIKHIKSWGHKYKNLIEDLKNRGTHRTICRMVDGKK